VERQKDGGNIGENPLFIQTLTLFRLFFFPAQIWLGGRGGKRECEEKEREYKTLMICCGKSVWSPWRLLG